jgi:hypothetical protein
MAQLRGAYGTNLLRNRRLGAELAEVVAALRAEGVETIVLKGGALARTVYQNAAQRPMADLDLLLRREEMERAGGVLTSLGFRLPDLLPVHLVPFERHFGGGLHWLRSRGDRTTKLDVQHHLVKTDWCRASFAVEPDALWASARPLCLGTTEAWQLSAEDTLICLCLHLALNHGYEWALSSYADMDRVVRARDGALSWSRLVDRAGRFGTQTAVYRGLRCARTLLGTPVPSHVLDILRPGGLQMGILERLAPLDPDTVLQGAYRQPGTVKLVMLYAMLVDHPRALGKMAQGLLFPGEEWLAARYILETRGQARLYRFIHPWHVAWAALQDLHRPLVESILH